MQTIVSFYPLLVNDISMEQTTCCPDTQQPETVSQSVVTLGCGTAGMIVSVPLAESAVPGPDIRPDWSTLMLRRSIYHSTTLALHRAKVIGPIFLLRIVSFLQHEQVDFAYACSPYPLFYCVLICVRTGISY